MVSPIHKEFVETPLQYGVTWQFSLAMRTEESEVAVFKHVNG